MEKNEETRLIAQLQNPTSRRQAFAVLVGQYSQLLYWQVRKIVVCHDDANDVLQNSFIKAWTNIDQFRGESKLSTWLCRIAINEGITFINKQRAQKNISMDDTDSFLLQTLESDPFFDGDEAQLKLQKAVLTLPHKQRMVFNLKYFNEMKYEEMSTILGTSIGALKASYHLAVKKVEEYLSASN